MTVYNYNIYYPRTQVTYLMIYWADKRISMLQKTISVHYRLRLFDLLIYLASYQPIAHLPNIIRPIPRELLLSSWQRYTANRPPGCVKPPRKPECVCLVASSGSGITTIETAVRGG